MNSIATDNEYIAPDSSLAFMLNYWHGCWRLMWHWHNENKGIIWPDFRISRAHRKYCDGSWDKIGIGFTVWRLSLCFSCQSIAKSRARCREMFHDDIWPTLIEDVLDADLIE